jgi:hypothetical protein
MGATLTTMSNMTMSPRLHFNVFPSLSDQLRKTFSGRSPSASIQYKEKDRPAVITRHVGRFSIIQLTLLHLLN